MCKVNWEDILSLQEKNPETHGASGDLPKITKILSGSVGFKSKPIFFKVLIYRNFPNTHKSRH